MAFSSQINTVVNGVRPVFAGFLADCQGDYHMGFVILAALTGLGTVFFLAAKKPAPSTRVTAQRTSVDKA